MVLQEISIAVNLSGKDSFIMECAEKKNVTQWLHSYYIKS